MARGLLTADHHEMVLQPVEPGHEDQACFVEARGRTEDVPRQRYCGPQDRVEARLVAARERGQCRRGRRRDRVEDAEQRVGVALLVARDQLGEIEVVTGVHPYARREAAAHRDLAVAVEQRDLDAIDLRGVPVDHLDGDVHRLVEPVVAPVARERRVEHVAQPVQDDRLAHLREQPVVDQAVLVGRTRAGRERAARHHDQPSAQALDGLGLVFIGADHVGHGQALAGHQVVGAAAREHPCSRMVARRVDRPADQLERGRPVEAHAALRGIHRLGHAEPEVPEPAAAGDGRIPVDRAADPGVERGPWIGDDMHRRERDPRERTLRHLGVAARLGGGEGREPAIGAGQRDRGHGGSLRDAGTGVRPER